VPPVAIVLAVLAYAPPSGHAGAELQSVSSAVKRAVRAQGADVVDGAVEKARAEHARGWVAEGALGFFARGRALADEGRRALERVELEKAEDALARAEQLYGEELVRPGVAELWSAVALERGVALFELGRVEAARRAFRRAVALDPAAELTEAKVRPDVARAFADAIAAGRARGRLTIYVVGAAPAQLSIDGAAPVPAPAALEVAEGEHLVRASAPGFHPQAALVDVGASGLEARLELARDAAAEQLSALHAHPAPDGVAALAALAGLDGVVAVAAGVDAGALTLVGARLDARGCATPLATVAVGKRGLDAAAAELASKLSAAKTECAPDGAEPALADAEPIAHPRPLPPPPPPPPPRKPRFYERPWLWAGLLVVTSAAVGTTAALVSRGTTNSVTWDPHKFGTSK